MVMKGHDLPKTNNVSSYEMQALQNITEQHLW